MLYFSQGNDENLSWKAFYQLKWAPTVVDNCGTFLRCQHPLQGCNDRLVFAVPIKPSGQPWSGPVQVSSLYRAERKQGSGRHVTAAVWR